MMWNHTTNRDMYWLVRHTRAHTDVHGQVHTLADVREAKHLFPFPAFAFAPSTCTQQEQENKSIVGCSVVKTHDQSDDNSHWHVYQQCVMNVHAYMHAQPVRFQTIVCSSTVNELFIALGTGKQSLWDRITLRLTLKLKWPRCQLKITSQFPRNTFNFNTQR